ncbi:MULTISPECIES: PfkB family carbohydrate kinase [Serratia]|uniref:PfkB family carbohydrate kinase n=1 Tax=Serratia TaxID=613 RepID=UPI0014957881|nr:PfkB family carbohydrate kinase [Serratia marcescens]
MSSDNGTITIAGGTYHEVCLHPGNHQVYGSAGRAASALATFGVNVELCTYADDVVGSVIRDRAHFENFTLNVHSVQESVTFHYEHGLAEPRIFNQPDNPYPSMMITAPYVLRYGMLEGSAVVDADYAVYDPQNVTNPEPFTANGSKAQHLALILNCYEARALSGKRELSDQQQAEFLYNNGHAEVIIIKQGPAGALIFDRGVISHIPAYETSYIHKIGSGDVFVAYFAYEWMINKKTAHEAANQASLTTAFYCENGLFPSFVGLAEFNPNPIKLSQNFIEGGNRKVYLAGPFFTLAQLWLVEQAQRNLTALGMDVFSPYHRVGHGTAEEVVEKDLDAIRQADVVFAIGDALDSGTIYEVGYARARDIPVVFYAENESEGDLKMMEGSGCILSTDYVTAIYKTLWVVAQK